MSTVLLVRHGRTHANAQGLLAGWSEGIGLDATGVEQAMDLRVRLSDVTVNGVVTSPLQRTLETASILMQDRPGVTVESDERLGECRYGDWTGRTLKELSREPLWKVVQGHPSAVTFPGGESLTAMQHRAVSAIREWNVRMGPDATYLVVSHGDVIKSILADALGMHLDQFQRLQVDPCSLSVVRYTEFRPFVERVNDTGARLATRKPSKGRRRRSSDADVGGGSRG